MNNFEYTDPIITKRRAGDKSSPFVDKDETHIIDNGKVTLTEIPDIDTGVRVVGLNKTWSEIKQGFPTVDQYHVDYNNKIVTFNILNNAKQLQFLYKGTGLIYVPASMIYTRTVNGDIVETLEDLFNKATEIPKEAVATFSAIATKYPSPVNGWTVFVNDVKKVYLYSSLESKWIAIRAVGDIVQGSVAPTIKSGLWIDTSK